MKIGRVVDLSQEVNLLDLKPFERIVAAARSAYRNTDMYRRRFAETEEQAEEARRKVLNSLIANLSATLLPFEATNLLEGKNDIARAIVVEVPVRYSEYIDEALAAHEFDAFNIRVISASDLLTKHADVPSLLYVEKR